MKSLARHIAMRGTSSKNMMVHIATSAVAVSIAVVIIVRNGSLSLMGWSSGCRSPYGLEIVTLDILPETRAEICSLKPNITDSVIITTAILTATADVAMCTIAFCDDVPRIAICRARLFIFN